MAEFAYRPDPSGGATLKISELLSASVDAARRGCAVIRHVQNKRIKKSSAEAKAFDSTIVMKEEGNERSFLTEADTSAQCAIISALRKTFGPHLKIIGEEDGNPDAAPLDETLVEVLSTSLIAFDKSKLNAAEDTVPIKSVCIFVDPLDG